MKSKINIAEVSQAVKKALTELYGERLEKVILYGSYARGDFHDESDVDFLVVLRDEKVKKYREIDSISRVIFPLDLHFSIFISCHPMSIKQFSESEFSFVRNVKKDGFLV